MTAILTGTTFAGYRVLEVIGQGGMGVVYRAHHPQTGRDVALKVLAGHLSGDEGLRARFRREAVVTGALDHPGIVTLFDAGEEEGSLYLVMRLVPGTTLDRRLGEGPLAPAECVSVAEQVGDALDFAHARGVIHRDVKPGNIFLDGPRVLLGDFGIARLAQSSGQATQTGMVIGTPGFMAPEQFLGQPAGPAADLYALGRVVVASLGMPLRPSEDGVLADVWRRLNEPPPRPSDVDPRLAPFDPVVGRVLARAPEDRYRSGREFSAALRAALARVTDADAARPPGTGAAPTYARGVRTPVPADAPAAAPAPPDAWSPPATVASAPAPPDRGRPRREGPFRAWRRARRSAAEEARGDGVAPPPPPPPPPAPRAEPGPHVAGDGHDPALPIGEPLVLRLVPGFRYVHEPLMADVDAIPFLGDRRVADALVSRISHSAGGSFLITGFRGVGKSTVVRRAIEGLRSGAGRDGAVVSVSLNVARRMRTDELLFEVIRRLFETLVEEGVFQELSPDARRALLLAYTRTSLSFKESRSSSVERMREAGLGGSVMGLASPRAGMSRRRTQALATEAAFLAYSDADAEHDFVRIARLLRGGPGGAGTAAPGGWHGHLVVVFDELDKLTALPDGAAHLESILGSLKNLFTTAGVHFLFVAGPDLHDACLRAGVHGDSVYESVFAWQLYVPCLWASAQPLLEALLAQESLTHPVVPLLRGHLDFKGRGIPRLLLTELNALVRWRDGDAVIEITPFDWMRLEFYAGLESALADFLFVESRTRNPFAVQIDEDRWRFGAYHVMDWILRRRGTTFTAAEISSGTPDEGSRAMIAVGAEKVERLLDHLVDHEVLESAGAGPADEVYMEDARRPPRRAYRLRRAVEDTLGGFVRGNERERADLGPDGPDGPAAGWQPWDDAPVLGTVGDGRYRLLAEVDRGGAARVYRARDTGANRLVAVKLLDPDAGHDDAVRARFEREVGIALGVDHPGIARYRERIREPGGRPGVVMDWVSGWSLREMLARGPIAPAAVVAIGLRMLDVLGYLSARGVIRLDLKPSRVMLRQGLDPVLISLGLAKHESPVAEDVAVTGVRVAVGTPGYAAPEQLRGEAVDARADLFALALILWHALTGTPPRAPGTVEDMLYAAMYEDLDPSGLRASGELRDVLRTATRRNPEDRFPTAGAMAQALDAVPEAAAGRDAGGDAARDLRGTSVA